MGYNKAFKIKFTDFVMVDKTAGGVLCMRSSINLCIISFVVFLCITRTLYCKCFCSSEDTDYQNMVLDSVY